MGIEHLKTLISFLLLTVQELATLDDDGNKKISISEAFEAIYKLAPKLPGIYANMPDVKGEIKDVSPEEFKELVDYVVEKFDLPGANDRIELIIKKSIGYIAYTYNFYRDIKGLTA